MTTETSTIAKLSKSESKFLLKSPQTHHLVTQLTISPPPNPTAAQLNSLFMAHKKNPSFTASTVAIFVPNQARKEAIRAATSWNIINGQSDGFSIHHSPSPQLERSKKLLCRYQMHIEMNKKKRRTTMSRGKASQIIAVDVAQHINIKLFYCRSSDSFFFYPSVSLTSHQGSSVFTLLTCILDRESCSALVR
jgi:hypothetical protein